MVNGNTRKQHEESPTARCVPLSGMQFARLRGDSENQTQIRRISPCRDPISKCKINGCET